MKTESTKENWQAQIATFIVTLLSAICKGFRVYLFHWWFHRYEAWYHLHVDNDHVWARTFPSITMKSRQRDKALKKFFGIQHRSLPFSFISSISYPWQPLSFSIYSIRFCYGGFHHCEITFCMYGTIIFSMLKLFSNFFFVNKYCKNSIFIMCDFGQWSSHTQEN